MKMHYLILILLSLICNDINATIGKIEVLGADKGPKIVFFSDVHTFSYSKRSYSNDVDYKQASWVGYCLNKYFKTTNHISIFENLCMSGDTSEINSEKDKKLFKKFNELAASFNEKQIFEKHRGYYFLFNAQIICHSYLLPTKNIEFRNFYGYGFEDNDLNTLWKFLYSLNNKLKFNNDYKNIKEILDIIKHKPTMNDLENIASYLIFDQLLLEIIKNSFNKDYIFVFVGGWHAYNVSKILKSFYGYKILKILNNLYNNDDLTEQSIKILNEFWLIRKRIPQSENLSGEDKKLRVLSLYNKINNLEKNVIYEQFLPINIKKFFDEFAIEENLIAQQNTNSNLVKIKSKL